MGRALTTMALPETEGQSQMAYRTYLAALLPPGTMCGGSPPSRPRMSAAPPSSACCIVDWEHPRRYQSNMQRRQQGVVGSPRPGVGERDGLGTAGTGGEGGRDEVAGGI